MEDQRLGGALLVARDGHIATITINRPEQRNAVNAAMWQDLADLMQGLGAGPGVRVVVVRGAGEHVFAAGADIAEFQQLQANPELVPGYLAKIEACMSSVESSPRPVIAMVNGLAIGGGCELATACDLRVAAEHAKFAIPAARLGVLVTLHDTRRLTDLIGPAKTREMLYTARTVDAREALQIGLVNQVVPAAELADRCYELARQIAQNSPLSVRGAKMQVNRCLRAPVVAGPDEALRAAVEAFTSADSHEGLRAFLEKRSPSFSGS